MKENCKAEQWFNAAQWSKPQGESFENIVRSLLGKLFPNYTFTHTTYRHDGGRDFYTKAENGDDIWVEAKNYSRHLELSKFAGTFIMADICNINHIFIFSTSSLTKGALRKIGRYASNHKKRISVYQNEMLLEIIDNYQLDVTKEIQNIQEILQRFRAAQSQSQTEKISSTLKYFMADDTSGSFETSADNVIKEVTRFSLIAIDVILKNNSAFSSQEVSVEFENIDRNEYKILSAPISKIPLRAGEVYVKTFFARFTGEVQTTDLPFPKIKWENTTLPVMFTEKDITNLPCRILGETVYLGPDSQKLSNLIGCLQQEQVFQSVLVYGKSGVGKTRFLQELQSQQNERGALTFIFQGDTTTRLSLQTFVRQFILAYYELDFDPTQLENSIVFKEGNGEFLSEIFNSPAAIEKYYTKLLNFFIAIMKTSRVTLFMDNAQSISDELIGFFTDLLTTLRNTSCESLLFFSFNTDYLLANTPNKSFFQYLKNEFCRKDFSLELCGFDETSAQTYLELSLDPRQTRGDLGEFCRAVVEKIGTTPLYLKQIVLYLYQKNIIYFEGDNLQIRNVEKFIAAIDEIPDEFSEMMALRYNLLKAQCKKNKTLGDLNDLFWLVLLFGGIPKEISEEMQIPVSLISLCTEMGFLSYNTYGKLLFSHQWIEKETVRILQGGTTEQRILISRLLLSKVASKRLQKVLKGYSGYPVEKMILTYQTNRLEEETFDTLLESCNFKKTNLLLYPLLVKIVRISIAKYLIAPQKTLQKLKDLSIACQDNLGLSMAEELFREVILFLLENKERYLSFCAEFLDLLKYYAYQMPSTDNLAFLDTLENLIPDFVRHSYDKIEDFQIWINNRRCKYYQDGHLFDLAEQSIQRAIDMATKQEDYHRLLECEIEYANACAYYNQEQAALHWKNAWEYFQKLKYEPSVYQKIKATAAYANALMREQRFQEVEKLCATLEALYRDGETFLYLKLLIDDIQCSYLLSKAQKAFSISTEESETLKRTLTQYRMNSLSKNYRFYPLAVYKSILYYRIRLKNENGNAEEKSLLFTYCMELLENYSWTNEASFRYFLPVYEQIVACFQENGFDLAILHAKTPPFMRQKLDELYNRNIKETFDVLHFNYVW